MMTVEEIAKVVGGIVEGDAKREIRGVASLETAASDDISFAEGPRSLSAAAASRAGCILILRGAALAGQTTIAVERPKWALVQAAGAVLARPASPAGIHPTAVVDPLARVAPDVSAGPGVVIERGARVGPGTRLEAGVFLGENVQVGAACHFYPRVTVYAGARIGDRVVLHAGVVIGSDGFGYVSAGGRHHKFPQIGEVTVGDDVEIGSNSTVDRGSLGKTVIGDGTKIDNLVQIAHNVRIGRNCLIASQTGISGSTEVGDNVVMGGQVGVGDHVRIESDVVIGGQAGVLNGKIVRRGTTLWGTPARPLAEFKKMYAYLSTLSALAGKAKESAGGKRAGAS
jgi:UDP-3-O-[3-hydroxymyristoyl] glucosamine N-acyltransferase